MFASKAKNERKQCGGRSENQRLFLVERGEELKFRLEPSMNNHNKRLKHHQKNQQQLWTIKRINSQLLDQRSEGRKSSITGSTNEMEYDNTSCIDISIVSDGMDNSTLVIEDEVMEDKTDGVYLEENNSDNEDDDEMNRYVDEDVEEESDD